jgi:thioredoxin 1
MQFTELSETDFYPQLAASPGVALLIFTGPDCGACRRLEKLLPSWLSGHVAHFYKVDAQRCPALARAYEVFHLPALFVFVDGQYHAPLQAEAAPGPLIGALNRLLDEPAHEEP